jgi:hypothetical protein
MIGTRGIVAVTGITDMATLFGFPPASFLLLYAEHVNGPESLPFLYR